MTHPDREIEGLLAATDGRILTTLPGVKTIRAAAFAAFSLPIDRFADAEHPYSATDLAPGGYQSSTPPAAAASRQNLAEHRDALMSIAWGLAQKLRALPRPRPRPATRVMAPIQPGSRRHACRLCFALLSTQQPFDEQRYRQARHQCER